MSYNLDPELAAALAANPASPQPPPSPPPGVSEWEFARTLSKAGLAPMGEYYKERLPDGESSLDLWILSRLGRELTWTAGPAASIAVYRVGQARPCGGSKRGDHG